MGVSRYQTLAILLLSLLIYERSGAADIPAPARAPAAIIGSTFDSGDEGWQVVGDAQNGAAIPDWRSTGGNLGGFLSVEDDVTGGTWYWQAPARFLGNRSVAYQTNLTFDLTQSEPDSQFDAPDVILVGDGVTLEFDTPANPGTTWTAYSVPLSESAGWTVQSTGLAPTTGEMQAVLGDLTMLRIRGEFRDGPDTGGLDNVRINGFQVTNSVFIPLVRR